MSLADLLAVDALAVFANLAEFGEEVTYYPEGQLHDDRTFRVVVERREQVPGAGDFLERSAVLHVPRSQLETVAVGRDLVELVLVPGKDPVMARVVRLIDHDQGMWEVIVTW